MNLSSMGPSSLTYWDQGVQGGSRSDSPNGQSYTEERGRDVELADDFESRGKRGGSPVYDPHTGYRYLRKDKKKSLASYGSWQLGSQALDISTSTSTSGSKSERFMSPYGDYDMDDSSFFAYTTRLNIIGPNPNSTRFLRRRSSSTERLLISCGERTMVTAATGTDRLRSPPRPTPLIPEKRTSPTESYMQMSLQSSLPLADPTASRKLLVLDLNGTLLLRSAHSGRRAHPPPPSHSRFGDSADSHPSSSKRPYSALRTVYPRPYLPSFCAYIFHPTTRQWLDTMVWSSAQPHSVNDMVDKCFGAYKEALRAVWARNTLGLSGDEYYKKTQTTKDLAKAWAQIPSLVPNPRNPPDNENCSPEVNDGPLQQHSAFTTILMDDSPLKAVLQPWNHLCVSEYGLERRKLDVEIAERELERMWLTERERAKKIAGTEKTTRDGATTNVDMAIKSSEETDVENKEAERKRKKREKKILKKGKLLLAKESYDEFLLAVIGILDGLKHEGNVAAWIRSGGLVHDVGDQETIPESNNIEGNAPVPVPTSETPETETAPMSNSRSPTSPLNPSIKRDNSTIPTRGPSKRRRLTHFSDTEIDPVSVTGERVLELASDSDMAVPPATPGMITTPLHSSPLRSSSPLSSSVQTLMGVPLSTAETPSCIKNSISTLTSTYQPRPEPLLWYEIPSVLSRWAQHGRKALAELGIEVTSGVVAPNRNGNRSAGDG